LPCLVKSPKTSRSDYLRWSLEVANSPDFGPAQKLAAARLRDCFYAHEEALLAAELEAADLVIKGLRTHKAQIALAGLRSTDPQRQRDAVRLLSSQPDQGLALLAEEIPKVADRSEESLPALVGAFEQTFSSASPEGRMKALGALLSRTHFSASTYRIGQGLVQWLETPQASAVGRELVLRLDQPVGQTWVGRKASVAWSTQVIRAHESEQAQRVAAARLLLSLFQEGIEGLRATQPESTRLLIEVLRIHADDGEQPAAARVLAEIDPEGSVRLLLGEARGADSVKRVQALKMLRLLYLQRRASPALVDSLVPELLQEIQSPCTSAFEPSATLLGVLGVREAVPALVLSLRAACAGSARTAVLRSLGSIKDPRSTAPLIELLNDFNGGEAFRTEVARTLGSIGDPRSTAPLIALLNDPNGGAAFRTAVAQALARIPDKDAQKASERFLNPWWVQPSTSARAALTLILMWGPLWTFVRRQSIGGSLRVAYCSLAFVSPGLFALILPWGVTSLPPLWLFVVLSLCASAMFIGSKEDSARRIRSRDEMATTQGALLAAAMTLALGWVSFLAGGVGVILLTISALQNLR
jgi:HEAT repeat protein